MEERNLKLNDTMTEFIVFGTTKKVEKVSEWTNSCVFFLQLIVCNPVVMLITFATVSEGVLTSGVATFISKFIEAQYNYPAGIAAMIGGMRCDLLA